MPFRTPFGTRATARQRETTGVPPVEITEWISQRLAAQTVKCP